MRRTTLMPVVTAVGFCLHGAAQPCVRDWRAVLGARPDGIPLGLLVQSTPTLPRVIMVGQFANVGGVFTDIVAVWDGSTWAPLSDNSPQGEAHEVIVYDEDADGSQPPATFLLGVFESDSTFVLPTRRFDGTAYSDVGSGIRGSGTRGIVWDEDGPGPAREALYVYGFDLRVTGSNQRSILKWDGATWTPMPLTGLTINDISPQGAFAVFDADGNGPEPERLYFGGVLRPTNANNSQTVLLRWNGTAWEIVQRFRAVDYPPAIFGLQVFDSDGDGPIPNRLFVGGNFTTIAADTPTDFVAAYDGQTWTTFAQSDPVLSFYRFCVFDPDANGPMQPELLATMNSGYVGRLINEQWVATPELESGGGGPEFPVRNAIVSGTWQGVPTVFAAGHLYAVDGVQTGLAMLRGCTPNCEADLDGDRFISLTDLAILLTNFGSPTAAPGDVNGDGVVNLEDLAMLLTEFGLACN